MTEQGIEVHYRCRACGEHNLLLTGPLSASTGQATARLQPAPDAA